MRWNAAIADSERRQSTALMKPRERSQALAMSALEKSHQEDQRNA
ncbi:hypothetical protein LHGZ1_1945 [Laribacter hongkongensis]|uniref:Uncharacterized protein n=1 Tax=Laribacter hongkongensis TaxID=168471 RepID=A0A248LK83_9NEIS|nr:hypothetical protein LHGZ1_1945 [Laribacter hongkongensis]